MELRLLCLHWSYLALHLAWAGLLWSTNKTPWTTTARGALEESLGKLGIGLVALIALFVGAASASRSWRTRFAAVEDAFPTGGEVVLGRWLAGLVGLLGALVEPLALAYLSGPPSSLLAGLPTFAAEATISFGFASALAWAVTLRTKGSRWVYPLLAGFWIACFAAPTIARTVHRDNPYFTILDFMHSHHHWYSELWGRIAWGRLPLLFDLTYVGLTLLLLGLLVAAYRRRRLLGPSPAGTLAVLLGLATAAGSGTIYLTTIANWGRLADADVAYQQAVSSHLTAQAGRAEDVQRYDVTADLSNPARPAFAAKLTLRNQGTAPLDRFALTLGRAFTVTASSLPVERDGDFLTLKLDRPLANGETREVSLRYAGQVFTVAGMYTTVPQPVIFTAAQGVRLPPAAGWYPLAGRQLFAPDADIFTADPAHQAVYAFHLQVRKPQGWDVLTNLSPAGQGRFDTERATWAMLFASPRLASEQAGTATLAAPRDDLPVLRPLALEYAEAVAYLVRFFPGARVTGLTLAIADMGPGLPSDTPPAGGQIMTVLDRWNASSIHRYENYGEMFIGHPLVNKLWAMTGGGWSAVVDSELARFLWAHYQANGDAARTRANIQQPEHHGFAVALCDVYDSQGDAGVIRVMDRLRGQSGTVDRMEQAQQAAWVKEAARAQ